MTASGRGFLDVWGSARGPVARLAPPHRIAAGVVLFTACLIAPPVSAAGTAFLLVTVAGWLVACGAPARVLRPALRFGLAVFLPVLLLAFVVRPGAVTLSWPRTDELWAALAVPWSIVARGLAAMLVSLGTAATLSVAELDEGLARLRVPRPLAALLVQIVCQTGTLVEETRRIAAALAVRSATSGLRHAVRVLAALPRVWLPRCAARADRVAAAMELRGFGVGAAPAVRATPAGRWSLAGTLVACAWLVVAVALHGCGAA